MIHPPARSPAPWPGTRPTLRLGPPPAQQVPAQQQVLLLRGEDLQSDRAVVAGRLELLDVLRPVGGTSRGGPQRQVLVRRAVVLRQVDVPQPGAEPGQALLPAVVTPLQLGM